jgi:hypothetical protein
LASWIVHLRITEKLLDMIDGLDVSCFTIGNIAPDSGIPDENWENFDYVRTHPDCVFWKVFLHSVYAEDYLSFLPQAAVRQRIAYIQAFYQRTDEEIEKWYIERPNLYLTEPEMGRFFVIADLLICHL